MPDVSLAELIAQQNRLSKQVPSSDPKDRIDALEREVKTLRDAVAELQSIVTTPKQNDKKKPEADK
jgi:hypothetical protein